MCYHCNPEFIMAATPDEMNGPAFCGGEPVCVCDTTPDSDEHLFNEYRCMPSAFYDIYTR